MCTKWLLPSNVSRSRWASLFSVEHPSTPGKPQGSYASDINTPISSTDYTEAFMIKQFLWLKKTKQKPIDKPRVEMCRSPFWLTFDLRPHVLQTSLRKGKLVSCEQGAEFPKGENAANVCSEKTNALTDARLSVFRYLTFLASLLSQYYLII